MKLKFSNVGKISNAEIDIESITVIAGINDTGKSTAGKLLYSISTALNLLKPKFLLNNKYRTILNELDSLQRWINVSTYEQKYDQFHILFSRFVEPSNKEYDKDELFKSESKLNDLVKEIITLINEEIQGNSYSGSNLKQVEIILKNLSDIICQSADDKEIKCSLIQDMLLTEFSGSLTSEITYKQEAKILMEEDNGDTISLEFLNNKLMIHSSDLKISRDFSQSFYIDDPFILDEPRRLRTSFHVDAYYQYKHRRNLLKAIDTGYRERNYFDEKLQSKKINRILSSVINGSIRRSGNNYHYQINEFSEPLSIESISAGMKSFSIIKMLMEAGYFNNSEFLILDEPEIHLHPEWQLKYAELIVLISQHYPIRIVITSHSPYFIEAIELYSKLHKIDDGVRYYKAESINNSSKIIDVTDNIETIYEDMAIPFRTLEELRDDLDG